MVNSLFICGVNHRMNVCRVQLKGMEEACILLLLLLFMLFIDSTNIASAAAINWKSHVFIHCPLCTTIFSSTIYNKIFIFIAFCNMLGCSFVYFVSIDNFAIRCDCKPILVVKCWKR